LSGYTGDLIDLHYSWYVFFWVLSTGSSGEYFGVSEEHTASVVYTEDGRRMFPQNARILSHLTYNKTSEPKEKLKKIIAYGSLRIPEILFCLIFW
jgi:hypothetical protein